MLLHTIMSQIVYLFGTLLWVFLTFGRQMVVTKLLSVIISMCLLFYSLYFLLNLTIQQDADQLIPIYLWFLFQGWDYLRKTQPIVVIYMGVSFHLFMMTANKVSRFYSNSVTSTASVPLMRWCVNLGKSDWTDTPVDRLIRHEQGSLSGYTRRFQLFLQEA